MSIQSTFRLWLVLFLILLVCIFSSFRLLHPVPPKWHFKPLILSTDQLNASHPCHPIQFPGSGTISVENEIETEHPGSWPIRTFKTISLRPPEFHVNTTSDSLSPGLILMNQKNNDPGVSESYRFGLYMFTETGVLVWAKEVPWSRDLQVQVYQGETVLTYWSAAQSAAKGISWGSITVLDSSYEEIFTVCPRLGLTHKPGFESDACDADLHVGAFTENNTILISTYNQTSADLSSVGGPEDGWIFDCVAYEIDRNTSKVLWQWSALEHVSFGASRIPEFEKHPKLGTKGDAWDWFHLNSIQKLENDQYLVNARNTFQTYCIGPGGDILWTLDGETGGDFGPLPHETWIAFSHDARIVSSNPESHTLSLFNNANGNGRYGVNASHGLLLHLPLPPGSDDVRVLQRFDNAQNPLYAVAQGNTQSLASDRFLVGYGYVPVAQEWAINETDVNAPAQLLWEARYGHDGDQRQYRVEKQKWQGTPARDPVVVVEHMNTTQCEWWRGFVSWNGATDVEGWALYIGLNERSMVRTDILEKEGFETSFNVRKGAGCMQLGAMRAGAVEVRRSAVVCDL